MDFDKKVIAAKLRRWEKYLEEYRLPEWDQIPDLGLYMEQVIVLLKDYLDYMPPEIKDDQFLTAATINNYVRMKIMPGPVKKRYYRVHIAYLLIICSLKQGMSLALIQKIIPMNISKDQVRDIYEQFCQQHSKAGDLFRREIRQMAGKILDHPDAPEWAAQGPSELIILTAMTGTFARLLTEKLLLMEGLDESHAGDLSLDVSRPHRSSTGKD